MTAFCRYAELPRHSELDSESQSQSLCCVAQGDSGSRFDSTIRMGFRIKPATE